MSSKTTATFQESLREALSERDLDGVKRIVDKGIRFSPYFSALRYGQWDAVHYFVDTWPAGLLQQEREDDFCGEPWAGESVTPWEDGHYPLHLAAKLRAPRRLLQRMIKACPDSLLLQDNNGRIPLVHALSSITFDEISDETYEVGTELEELKKLKLLAGATKQTLVVKDNEGNVPLHYAVDCSDGVCGLVATLCKKAIWALNDEGRLPLHVVLDNCRKCSPDSEQHSRVLVRIVKFLVQKYPQSLLVHDGRGMLPIHIAFQKETIKEFLVNCLLPSSALHALSCSRSDMLMARNSKSGETAMHYAAAARADGYFGYRSWAASYQDAVFKGLAEEFPVLFRVPDASGRLPLHVCRYAERMEMALLHYPGGASQRDDGGKVPLHLVHDIAMVNLLLEAYPNAASQQDNDGNLPLHFVSDDEAAEILIDAYPDGLSVANNQGKTPLHTAVENNFLDEEIVESMILSNPAGATALDRKGNLPLFYAAERHSLDTLHLLVHSTKDLFDWVCKQRKEVGRDPLYL